MLSLAFIANSFRVTEENLLLFQTDQPGQPPFFFINFIDCFIFTALKGTNFYIISDSLIHRYMYVHQYFSKEIEYM